MLFEVWKSQCYWCKRPKTFQDIQIDHIVPRATGAARLQQLIEMHGLPADFHVDRPANLAPICGPCNIEKSSGNYLIAPLVTAKLRRAQRHEAEVVRRVRAHATANTVARDLTRAVTANLRAAEVRRSFLRHAPAVVQTLALIDESKTEFVVGRDFEVDLGGYFFMPVSLTLDTRGRTAQSVIEDLCGCTLPDALDDSLLDLMMKVSTEVQNRVEGYSGDSGSVGPATIDSVRATLDFWDLRRRGPRLIARFTGNVIGSYTASVVQDNQWGDGMLELHATAYVDLPFAISASWKMTGPPGQPDRVRSTITSDGIEITLE
jgi:hypothetical protein